MPRPRQTEEQIQAMRTRILDATYKLLIEKGPQSLSSRAIADELGIAHMTLYTYFKNQADILAELSDREMAKVQKYQADFERRAFDGQEDIIGVMRDALEFYPNFDRDNPQLFHLAWILPLQGVENTEQARKRSMVHVEHLARLISAGIERGVFHQRQSFLAAAVVFGMVNFPLVTFRTGRIANPQLRDMLVAEVLDAAIIYLCHGS